MIEQANSRPLGASLAGWADHGHGNLAQRLSFRLRRLIDAGVLAPGTQLPPERRLAGELAVSRATVSAALDELRAEGLVESHQGRGTTVVGGTATDAMSNRIADGFVLGAGGIDLAVGNPADVSHLPPVAIDIADILAAGTGPGFHPLGLPALRAALAQRHSDRGLLTEPDEVHITAGAHQAVSLLVGSLIGHHDRVAMQNPNYPGMFDILDGATAHAAPVDGDSAGMLPESLDRVLSDVQPRLVYTQLGPHNPTGVVPTRGRLRAIAEVLDRHDVTVIEDATLELLCYEGAPTASLATLCRKAPVVSIGSFSKVLWGGLRVGWIRAAPPIIDRTLYHRLALDLGTAVPSELLCLALLPHLDDIAARRRAELSGNIDFALGILADELPELEVSRPAGGSVLWGSLPLADAGPLVQFARRHGVHVAPGSMSMAGQVPDPHVRICVDRPQPLVEIGLTRLGAAWRELNRRPLRVAG